MLPAKQLTPLSTNAVFVCLAWRRYVLADVSFSCVCGPGQDYFVFFQKDESLKLYTCHIFKCASERAFDIATAVGRAFAAYATQLEQYGGDPFRAIETQGTQDQSQLPQSLLAKQMRRTNLKSLKPIGAGQFGQVYLAHDTTKAKADRQHYAVKLLRRGAAEEDYQDFVSESESMLALQHENIVNLLGVAIQQRPWLLVLEYCEHGDLRRLLRACASKGIELRLVEQHTFASQICTAMEYVKQNLSPSLPLSPSPPSLSPSLSLALPLSPPPFVPVHAERPVSQLTNADTRARLHLRLQLALLPGNLLCPAFWSPQVHRCKQLRAHGPGGTQRFDISQQHVQSRRLWHGPNAASRYAACLFATLPLSLRLLSICSSCVPSRGLLRHRQRASKTGLVRNLAAHALRPRVQAKLRGPAPP